ncbi:MAG: hypothetical protein AcusKO_02830 [Acuticoccus sp.]
MDRRAVTQENGSTPLDVIESLLCKAWGHFEPDYETLVVGEADGAEIFREVAVFTRTAEEDKDAI